MSGDFQLNNVAINEPKVVLHDELKKILLETRLNRDAIMLAHNDVNILQDKYNKFIIVLSLFSAFFESIKGQLDLAERKDFLSPLSILMPILLTTILGIISSMMKFKKFPERMELLTKSTEKCNVTILKIRKLQENLNFQTAEASYRFYIDDVMMFYRDALDCYEKALYPNEHSKYLEMARRILKDMKKKTHNFEKPKKWYSFLICECCESPSLLIETQDKGIDTNSPSNNVKVNSKNNEYAHQDSHENDDDFNISFGAFPRDEEEGNNLEDENESDDNNENKIIEKPKDNAKI
tara:strand:- start:10256 stop:11137 length:882 start_codon:yes stop_codon:yes gene_type:complete